MRTLFDKIFKGSIKLCLLTGVAFSFAACYGPPPERYLEDEPEFKQDQQRLEQQLTTPQDSENTL